MSQRIQHTMISVLNVYGRIIYLKQIEICQVERQFL